VREPGSAGLISTALRYSASAAPAVAALVEQEAKIIVRLGMACPLAMIARYNRSASSSRPALVMLERGEELASCRRGGFLCRARRLLVHRDSLPDATGMGSRAATAVAMCLLPCVCCHVFARANIRPSNDRPQAGDL